jgi:carbon starvation protein
LVTLIPLVWLLAVTGTAGWQKIFHPSPRIGFLAGGRAAAEQTPKLEAALQAAESAGRPEALSTARAALNRNRIIRFNAQFDWIITAVFLGFAAVLLALSIGTWFRLLSGRLVARLSEEPPTWLPDGGVPGSVTGPGLAGVATLALALLRVWSGQTEVDREVARTGACQAREARGSVVPRILIDVPEVRQAVQTGAAARAYVDAAEHRFLECRRCC